MKSVLHYTMMWLVVIVLITGFALPHLCLDGDGSTIKTEQQLASAHASLDGHIDGSKIKDGCCTSHHCCVAKLVQAQPFVLHHVFYADAHLTAPATIDFSSFSPQGLDRPPKFFA
jgi:hypothetical protein